MRKKNILKKYNAYGYVSAASISDYEHSNAY
jgi:hypothetical protein